MLYLQQRLEVSHGLLCGPSNFKFPSPFPARQAMDGGGGCDSEVEVIWDLNIESSGVIRKTLQPVALAAKESFATGTSPMEQLPAIV